MLQVLQARFPALTCVSANIQPIPHAILEGPTEIIVTEKRTIAHQLGTLRLRLAPQAFVQTNVEVATKLYQTAANWIADVKPAKALELFSGQGAFSFFAAKSATELLGIEINADAVNTANETARELGLTHLNFRSLDATKIEAGLAQFAPDLILANPPRRGLAAGLALIESILPRYFIYSSCSIETLAEDLQKLSKSYRLRRAQLFDLFPHTEHFETLVLLERRATL
jgi:23S rRNA (uracil747-C5)-methyltransferase